MIGNSFSWWLINFGMSILWIVGSIMAGTYFLAAGGVIYIAVMMLIELPGTSSEEGSADEDNDGLPF